MALRFSVTTEGSHRPATLQSLPGADGLRPCELRGLRVLHCRMLSCQAPPMEAQAGDSAELRMLHCRMLSYTGSAHGLTGRRFRTAGQDQTALAHASFEDGTSLSVFSMRAPPMTTGRTTQNVTCACVVYATRSMCTRVSAAGTMCTIFECFVFCVFRCRAALLPGSAQEFAQGRRSALASSEFPSSSAVQARLRYTWSVGPSRAARYPGGMAEDAAPIVRLAPMSTQGRYVLAKDIESALK